MELKELTLAEKNAVRDLFRSVFTAEPWNDDWSDGTQLDAYLTDLMGNVNSLSFGLYDDDRLIALSMGYIKHWYAGTEYVIEELCVARDRQGKGVGTRFLRSVEQTIARRGIRHVFLLTDRALPAFDFYQKAGYRECEGITALAKSIES